MSDADIKIPVIRVEQQIGEFFVGKVTAEKLVKMSYSDIRKLTEERDVESYLGIQRPLDKKRAKDIQNYVKNVDATFPTSIILSIEEGLATFDEATSVLTISNGSPAKILDGQHRVAGFMDLASATPIKEVCWFKNNAGELVPFELLVTIFVGLDMAEQANIFSTVNITQTKVSKSLVYDLETYSKCRSPQKTAHEIVVALDQHPKSPFYGKIKRLGKKIGEFETLTQAALVEEIIALISKNAMADRDFLLRQERGSWSQFRKGLSRSNYEDGLVFRNAFIEDQDALILKTITAFFLAVKRKWQVAWDKENKNSLLNRTVGVYALFRVLRKYCSHVYSSDGLREITLGEFEKYFDRISLEDDYFENLDAKTASVSKLTSALTVII